MNRYDCETVRDFIPVLVRNELLPHEAAATESHLEQCTQCREEAALVRLFYTNQPTVPAGLEARVLLAVRAPVASRRWTPARLAMAATVAAALLGGTFVLERMGAFVRPTAEQTASLALDANAASVFSWAAAEAPWLHGSSALEQLSAEELEKLLAELGS